MTLYRLALRRIISRKLTVILMLAVPIGVVLFGTGGAARLPLQIGIVDNDGSELSAALFQRIDDIAVTERIEGHAIRTALFTSDVAAVLEIPQGFQRGTIAGSSPAVSIYSLRSDEELGPVTFQTETFIHAVRNMADRSAASADIEFEEALRVYQERPVRVSSTMLEPEGELSAGAVSRLRVTTGFLIVAMLFVASVSGLVMFRDRNSGTLARLLCAPTTMPRYMGAYIAALLTVSAVQVLLVVAVASSIVSPSAITIARYAVVLITFSLLCVALTVALAGASKSHSQLVTMSTLIIIPIAMLGGSFWPVEIMPQALQTVSRFLPTTWANTAAAEVLNGSPLISVLPHLGILVGFSLLLFLLGSWRSADIVRS